MIFANIFLKLIPEKKVHAKTWLQIVITKNFAEKRMRIKNGHKNCSDKLNFQKKSLQLDKLVDNANLRVRALMCCLVRCTGVQQFFQMCGIEKSLRTSR